MTKDQRYPRRGLHGEFVHAIGVRIVGGDLRPGDPLPTEVDGGEADVSRTVVRESIKVLAAKGLVVSRPKTGTQVRERRFWNLLDPDVLAWRVEAEAGDAFFVDLFELRRLIEPKAAALASVRASAEEIAELEESFSALAAAAAAAADDPEAHLVADLRFHAIILDCCHNELLAHLGSTLRAAFKLSFARTQRVAVETLAQHEAVLAGIRDGDGAAAEAAMLELIETTASVLQPTS